VRALWVLGLTFVSLPAPLARVDFLAGAADPTPSWQIGVVLAARAHLQWGTQIIWTYGPLGYLDRPVFVYFPQWLVAVGSALGVQLAFLAVLSVLLSRWRAPLWAWLVLGGVLVAPSGVAGVPDVMGLFLGVLLAAIALEDSDVATRMPSAWAAAAGVVLALTALTKATSLLTGALVIVVFVVLAALRRRPRPMIAAPLGYLAGFCLGWAIAGQALTDIPAYILSTLQLVSGYSAAMSSGRPAGSIDLVAGLGAAIVAALMLVAIVLWRRRLWAGLRFLLLLAPIVVFNFKEGFVRADAIHEFAFFSIASLSAGLLVAAAASHPTRTPQESPTGASLFGVAPAAALLLAIAAGQWLVASAVRFNATYGLVYGTVSVNPKRAAFVAVVVILAAGLLVVAATVRVPRLHSPLVRGSTYTALAVAVALPLVAAGAQSPLLQVGTTADGYHSAWTLITDPEARTAELAAQTAEIRHLYDLPSALVARLASGTVGIVPWDIAIAYAYGLDWDPSPVLQSYSAYTSYLDDRDAAHFSSGSAPDSVLLADTAIDGQYPAFVEPAEFQALLRGYRSTPGADGQYVVLTRAAGPGNPPVLVAGDGQEGPAVCAPMGADIPVPQRPGAYTFASLSVRYSLSGTLSDIVYKPANVRVQFTLEGASPTLTAPYKLIPATAVDGLFVSGYLASANELAQAFDGVITRPISAIRVTTPDPGEYQTDVCARFSTIPINPAP